MTPPARPTARWRLPAVVVAAALLVAACAPTSSPAEPTEPHTIVVDEGGPEAAPITPEPEPSATSSADGALEPAPAGGTDGSRPDGAGPPRDDSEADAQDQPDRDVPGQDEPDPPATDRPAPAESAWREVDDRGPLGGACRAYLRSEVPGLTIEVLHQAGARPSSGAIDHLLANLTPVVDKPAGVEVTEPREIPGQARTWSVDELRSLAASHRTATSTPERAGLLVLLVAGDFEDPGVLGLAMNATEIVLFPDQIGGLGTSLLGGSARIERAVLLHEVGHLLCLVNLGYQSPRDHEDRDHPHHSRHRDSVMYWAVANDAITQVFAGPPPDRFHADDLADLRDLRDGRL